MTPPFSIGHYQVTAAVGKGGMGEVYRALDTRLGREVALKLLPAEMSQDQDRLARFQREARAVAALNHPNIVTLYSVEENDGRPFLTMELIEGRSLDDFIREGLPLDRVLEIGTGITEALQAAHEKGLAHRDLKPGNIMITPSGRVKVLDFGLAKDLRAAPPSEETVSLAGHTEVGVTLGTPPYMSPEQIRGETVDHRTDIFSLGIILYEMAAGRRPFDGRTSVELAASILRDPAPLGGLPSSLVNVIEQCLVKEPSGRIPSAKALGERLERARVAPRSHSSGTSHVAAGDEGFWVAVQLFKHRAGDEFSATLAEGLQEEITTAFSRFSWLRVISAGSTRTPGYVLEGSVRVAGSSVRVTAQLTDVASGEHLWAETYDRSFRPEDVFALQDDLMPRIVTTVASSSGILARSMSECLRSRSFDEMTPYECMLRSFSYYERQTPDEHAEVRDALERLVSKTHHNEGFHALLSMLYQDEYRFGYNARPDPLGRALLEAQRAVEASPTSHMAYHMLASAHFFRRELPAFRKAAERSLELNPYDGINGAYLAGLIASSGEWEHGMALWHKYAAWLSAPPGWIWFAPFFDSYRRKDYPEALSFALRVNMPRFFRAQATLAVANAQVGELAAARTAVQNLLALKPNFATEGPEELARWLGPCELLDSMLDGLRKAGLKVPGDDEPLPSIAVLPFANLTASPDQEYFSDGLAEEIISLLTHIPGLRVIARTSSFAFRGKEEDLGTIAKALGVRSILEGSVRRAGTRVRVTAQLVDPKDGSQLWSERYDRDMTDVFAVQDEIATAIARELRVKLSSQVGKKPRYTPKFPAYEALLKAKHLHWKVTRESMEQAKEFYEQAIALDPQFAQAHALYADYLFGRTTIGLSRLREIASRSRELALKALELDPENPEANSTLGTLAAAHDYDWAEAKRRFTAATSVESAPPLAHTACGYYYLLGSGRAEEGAIEAARAIQADPMFLTGRTVLAHCLAAAGKAEQAEDQLQQVIRLDPNFVWGNTMLAFIRASRGRWDEALSAAADAYAAAPWYARGVGLYAGLLTRSGQSDRGLEVIASLGAGAAYGSSAGLALFCFLRGDQGEAAQWFAKAIDERDAMIVPLLQGALFEPFRASPHWPSLACKLNLPA